MSGLLWQLDGNWNSLRENVFAVSAAWMGYICVVSGIGKKRSYKQPRLTEHYKFLRQSLEAKTQKVSFRYDTVVYEMGGNAVLVMVKNMHRCVRNGEPFQI